MAVYEVESFIYMQKRSCVISWPNIAHFIANSDWILFANFFIIKKL